MEAAGRERDADNLAIAALIRKHMRINGTTQRQIRTVINKSRATVTRRLAGEVAFTGPELVNIARYLGVSVAEFHPDRHLAAA